MEKDIDTVLFDKILALSYSDLLVRSVLASANAQGESNFYIAASIALAALEQRNEMCRRVMALAQSARPCTCAQGGK